MTDPQNQQAADDSQNPPAVQSEPANDAFNAPEEETAGAPAWIVTFADMMSLLLCFFVLLLSFSVMDAEKFRAVAESLKEAFSFNVAPVPGQSSPETSFEISDPQQPSQSQTIVVQADSFKEQLEIAKREIDNYIEKAGLSEHIHTKISSNYLEIVNSNPLNFPAGKAELLESSLQYLDAIIPVLKDSDFRIIVEGHTDDVPINTATYRSNWELSAARAASFVSYLEQHGVDSQRLVVHGYGPNRPVAPNDTDGNRARNRRIEIMIKSMEDEQAEMSEYRLDEQLPTASVESDGIE